MTQPMGEFGDEPETNDTNDQDAVVETATEYGEEPEPANVPAPGEDQDQNPGHTEGDPQ